MMRGAHHVTMIPGLCANPVVSGDRASQATSPVVAEDDQAGVLVARELHDAFRSPTLHDGFLRLQVGFLQAGDDFIS